MPTKLETVMFSLSLKAIVSWKRQVGLKNCRYFHVDDSVKERLILESRAISQMVDSFRWRNPDQNPFECFVLLVPELASSRRLPGSRFCFRRASHGVSLPCILDRGESNRRVVRPGASWIEVLVFRSEGEFANGRGRLSLGMVVFITIMFAQTISTVSF